MKSKKPFLTVREIAIFGMLGGLMYASKILMNAFPNVHFIGLSIMALTLVYRVKALFPIYVFVLMHGFVEGFSTWWVPYLYIWAVLWGVTMLLPKKMPQPVAVIVYMVVCGLHGLAYGTLFAPMHALFFHLDFKGMIAWVVTGFPWDIVHGTSNFIFGSMVLPLAETIRMADYLTRTGEEKVIKKIGNGK